MVNQSIQHLRPFTSVSKRGTMALTPSPKIFPDFFHVFILHLDSITDEFYRVGSDLALLDQAIDDDTPTGIPNSRNHWMNRVMTAIGRLSGNVAKKKAVRFSSVRRVLA